MGIFKNRNCPDYKYFIGMSSINTCHNFSENVARKNKNYLSWTGLKTFFRMNIRFLLSQREPVEVVHKKVD